MGARGERVGGEVAFGKSQVLAVGGTQSDAQRQKKKSLIHQVMVCCRPAREEDLLYRQASR